MDSKALIYGVVGYGALTLGGQNIQISLLGGLAGAYLGPKFIDPYVMKVMQQCKAESASHGDQGTVVEGVPELNNYPMIDQNRQ